MFTARLQSELASGAAWVALVLIAYARLHSAWAVTFVLLADFLPGTFLSPLIGAAADRYGRRRMAILGDVLSAVAFVAIGLLGGFWTTVLFAFVAGTGACISSPALKAALPSMVKEPDRASVMVLSATARNLGWSVGPALCAAALLITGPAGVLVVNGVTFAFSALILSRLNFGAAADVPAEGRPESFTAELKEGFLATAEHPQVRWVLGAGAGIIIFAAIPNIAKPLLATQTLHASASMFGLMTAATGVGVVLGALYCATDRPLGTLLRRFLAGIGLLMFTLVGCGASPTIAVALVPYAVGGIATSLIQTNQSLFIVKAMPDHLLGRTFGLFDALQNVTFTLAFLSAGALLALAGTRATFYVAAAGAAVVYAVTASGLRASLRRSPLPEPAPTPAGA
jgi:MFS family permease